MVTETMIVDYVTDFYLQNARDLAIKEIAQGIGVSEGAVRRVITAAHGCPVALQCYQQSRPRYEKNYGMEHGSSRVWVYGPTRSTLRDRVISAVRGPAQ